MEGSEVIFHGFMMAYMSILMVFMINLEEPAYVLGQYLALLGLVGVVVWVANCLQIISTIVRSTKFFKGTKPALDSEKE